MRTISSYGSIFLITSSILSFFASISCSEKSEIDRMNEIWDKAELWRNLEDNNGTVRSKKTGKVFTGWGKEVFPSGDFHLLVNFISGNAKRVLQWDIGGIKIIDANIIPKSISFNELPLKYPEFYSPFTSPIFQTIQNLWNENNLIENFLPVGDFMDFNGSVRTWYKNGCPRVISTWKDGRLDGEFINYWNTLLVFHDPPVRIKGSMLDGKLDGNFTMSYIADNRINDLEEITIYNLDFIARLSGSFEKGRRIGVFEYIRGNGNKSQATFINDQKHGPSITWNKSGVKIQETTFKNAQKHGSYFQWHSNGNKKEEGKYEYDYKNGPFIFYNRDGKKLYHQIFENGQLTIE